MPARRQVVLEVLQHGATDSSAVIRGMHRHQIDLRRVVAVLLDDGDTDVGVAGGRDDRRVRGGART